MGSALRCRYRLRGDASDYSDEMSNLLEQLSPRFSTSYGISEKVFLNFNTGIYYQRPSYTTLGYRDQNSMLVNKQNDITYIRANHYVTGLEWNPNENARVTGEVFYKQYRNYPFSVEDSVAISSKGANFGVFGDEEVTSEGTGRTYGFELYSRLPSVGDYNFILSYTFVRSEFEDLQGDYVPTAWDNKHIVNLTARRSFENNWDVGMKWRYVGGAPYTPYDLEKSQQRRLWDLQNEPYLDYDRFNSLRLNAFHQLDIRVDKTYFFEKWMLGFYLDIQNAYNFTAQNQDRLTNLDSDGNPNVDPQNPEEYDLRRIEQESGTVLPSIGIKVEF
ncbi:MAG: hypothetical protein U5L09_08350 [Bacteroidales bacterium]|nr:hypothetical protein [Bacteroidales bacterium]